MSDSRSILLRLSVRDADVVRQQLVAMGEQGSAALARLDAAARAAAGTRGTASRSGGGGGSGMGGLTSMLQAGGYQLQDFAVQVQGGTSALTALSQQGSQFLGAFGPAGAIAGAVLTVGILASKLFEAADASKKMQEAQEALAAATRITNDLFETQAQRVARMEREQRASAVGGLQTAFEAQSNRVREERRALTLLEQEIAERTAANANVPDFDPSRIFGVRLNAQRSALAREEAQFLELNRRLEEARNRRSAAEIDRLDLGMGQFGPPAPDQYGPPAPGSVGYQPDPADEMRRQLDARFRIQEAYTNRIQELRNFDAAGMLRQGELARREAQAARERDLALQSLAQTEARQDIGHTQAGTPLQLRTTLDNLRNQEANRLQDEITRFTNAMDRPLDAYKRRMQEITILAQRAQEAGNPIPAEDIQQATNEALGAFQNLARGMEQTNQLGQQLGMTFSSAFEDAIVKGKSFREVLSGVAQDLARLVVRQSITAPLGNVITKSLGSFDLGSMFSGLFGGGKAIGGPVMAGTTYLVGERGPELFTPGASGAITPNHAIGGGVSMTLNIDARGAGPREIDQLRSQIPAIARAAVEDAARRGGSFARTIRGG